LVFFLISFTIITYSFNLYSNNNHLINLFFPITMYIFGYSFSERDIKYKKTYAIIFLLIVSTSIYMLLSYFSTLSLFGSLEAANSVLQRRSLKDFWGNGFYPATVVTLYLSLGLSIMPTLFVSDN